MALAIFCIFKAVTITYQTVSPSCCVKKTVGAHSYTLTDKPPDVSTDSCLEQCFYNRDGEELNVYCFQTGDLNLTCNDDTTPEPNVISISGGGSGFGCNFDFGSGSGLVGGSGFGSGYEFGGGFGVGCGFEYEGGSGFVEGFEFGSGPDFF